MDPNYELPEDAVRASDLEEATIKWLIPERIPQKMMTLIAGRPGQGKSLFISWLAAEVSRQGHGVIIGNVEDLRAEVLRPRVRMAGADMRHVYFWNPEITTAMGIAALEQFIRALNVKVLILDPISGYLGKRMDDRTALRPLTDLAERTGIAIIAIHHTVKNPRPNAHPLDAVRGDGTGMLAAARFVYLFGRNADDPDERLLVIAKGNHTAEGAGMVFQFDLAETEIEGETQEVPRLMCDEPVAILEAAQILRDGHTTTSPNANPVKRAIASEWLTTLLMVGQLGPHGRPEVHANEVKAKAEADNLSWATVRRASDSLGVTKRSEARGYGKGRDYFWSLPEGHPALKVMGTIQAAATAASAEGDELTVQDFLAQIDAAGTVPDPNETTETTDESKEGEESA